MTIETLYAIAAAGSAVSAVLAWTAKIYWAKEYREAKQAEIGAKDALIKSVEREAQAVAAGKDSEIDALRQQIQTLRDLSPKKLKDQYVAMSAQYDTFMDALNAQLSQARSEIATKDTEISALQARHETHSLKVTKLEAEKILLKTNAEALQARVTALEQSKDRFYLVDPDLVEAAVSSSGVLSSSLSGPGIKWPDNLRGSWSSIDPKDYKTITVELYPKRKTTSTSGESLPKDDPEQPK